MCSVVRALVLFVLCLAVMARAETSVNPVLEGSTTLTSGAPVREEEMSAGPTEASEASSSVSTVADTQTSTSASSFIVASTLAVPLLPALMLGY
nr:expressed protein [Hymenolepis microstoma]